MKCITSRPIPSFALSSTPKRYLSTLQQPCKAYLEPTHAALSPTSVTTKDILNRGRQYLLPVYARPDFVLSHGKGAWVWDVDGRRFLDFSAGIAVNALGHADEGVLKASLHYMLERYLCPLSFGLIDVVLFPPFPIQKIFIRCVKSIILTDTHRS